MRCVPGSADGLQVHDHVAVGVEAAAVADVAVVVVDAEGVVELGPADTLDADRELLTVLERVVNRHRTGRPRWPSGLSESLAVPKPMLMTAPALL